VRAHLDHIHTVNPRLNAVVFATAESALKQARRRPAQHAQERPGPLHGVPFTAKDIFDTAGLPTTAGLRMLRTNIPDHDATAIARMREAGAILIGKTNCPPGGVGGDSWNPLHGGPATLTTSRGLPGEQQRRGGDHCRRWVAARHRKRFGRQHSPAGALLRNRRPQADGRAHPEHRRLRAPGRLTDPRSQVGPMARFVADLALVLPLLIGPDGVDSGVVPVPLAKRTPKLGDLKWRGTPMTA